ncbi:MAG: hypothetical protein V4692_00915 [Bdellovibrionota bacterium]
MITRLKTRTTTRSKTRFTVAALMLTLTACSGGPSSSSGEANTKPNTNQGACSTHFDRTSPAEMAKSGYRIAMNCRISDQQAEEIFR